jgi:hypothetical protein
MTSKAERKRRAKRAKITLPGGETAPQRPTGLDRRHTNQAENPMQTVTAARQRRTGIADPQDARQPLCGTDMGLCIRAMTLGDNRAEMTNAWAAISAAHRNYRLLIIGQTGDPQGAAIPMLPEAMETDPSLRIDLRTHEQRVDAAKAAWRAWEAKINALPMPSLKWALRGALDGFLGDGALWRDQAPTQTGRIAVQALRMALDA